MGLYLTLGWIGIMGIAELVRALPGGALFSLGGATYATQHPDPFPRVFGYHEMFHTLQVTATAALYYVVAIYVVQS